MERDGEHAAAVTDHSRRSVRATSGDGQGKGEEQTEAKSPARKIHFSRRTLIIAGAVAVVLLVAGILYWLHARNFVSTDDAYTAAHIHPVSVRVAGTVAKVLVTDNQPVHAGDELLALDDRDFQLALEKARAQMQQAQAQVTQRRATADQAQAGLDKAQADYERVMQLAQTDYKGVSKADVDNATAALKAAQGAMEAARADLVAAEANLATAGATVDDAQLQLSYTTVIAPADGLIGKKTVETGGRVQPGQALMAVVERNVWVLANYKETQLARVVPGQAVEVEIDAIPGHVFKGHVDSFQPGTGSAFALLPPDNATGNFTKIVQRVPVKILIDNFDGFRDRIFPGMSCAPTIDLRTAPRR